MKRSEAIELATSFLSYNKDTGHLTWIGRTGPRDMTGQRAGTQKKDGYRYVRFKNHMILEHRLCWLIVMGELPYQIDHINQVKSDNRFCNLRAASNYQNSMNKTRQSNNTTGFKGVSFHKQSNKYAAKICLNGKRQSLGYFTTAEQAHQAYIKASTELHGEFARH
jgi:HNH endonuclease/AP2 domain